MEIQLNSGVGAIGNVCFVAASSSDRYGAVHPIPDHSDLLDARARIAGHVHRTPLWPQATLSERFGRPVYLKCEHLQKTGSYKVRGLLHHMLRLSEAVGTRGVVTISAGNAAQAVAWSARAAGVPCTVVMPANANPLKVEASRGYGADVILHGTAAEAFRLVRDVARERDLHFVHPFDDPDVVAGHASTGLEVLEDLPDVEAIVVPTGGGGLVSGIAAAVHESGHPATVWAVEPEGACTLNLSFEQGHAVRVDTVDTIADGLAAPMTGELNYAVVAAYGTKAVRVSDDSLREGMRLLAERAKQIVEPSGAAGVAALLENRIDGSGPVVLVLSGGNVDRARFAELVTEDP